MGRRATVLACVAVLIFDSAALAQSAQPAAKPPSSMKQIWTNVKARQACRKEATLQKIPAQDRNEFILTCARRLAKGDTGKDVLPKLFISSDAEKADFKGLWGTGEQ